MLSPKNLLIFGAVLLFVGICLPFFLIASRGLGQASTVSVKKRKEARTLRQNITDILWSSIIIFIILPLIISTLYHFIKHVFWGAMPFNDFTKDLGVYSYQPVMAFYKEMFAQLQMIITQQKTTPQP